jgi:hypothetical protein
MTTGTILILSAIVGAFAVFGVVLAWGDYYSRRRAEAPPLQPAAQTDDRRKAA